MMLGMTSFVAAQVCSQNQACCSAMLHAHHEQWKGESSYSVCVYVYGSMYT